MRCFIIFSLLLLLSGCTKPQEAPYPVIESDEVTRNVVSYSEKLKREQKLLLHDSCLYGDIYQQGYVDSIYLEYTTQRLVDLCEARHLIVDVVEGFVEKMQDNPILKWEVARYPFSHEDLEVQIHFTSYYGKYVDPLYVERIILQNGYVHFYAFTAFDPATENWQYHVEPYEKTRLIAQTQKEAEMLYSEKEEENDLPSGSIEKP